MSDGDMRPPHVVFVQDERWELHEPLQRIYARYLEGVATCSVAGLELDAVRRSISRGGVDVLVFLTISREHDAAVLASEYPHLRVVLFTGDPLADAGVRNGVIIVDKTAHLTEEQIQRVLLG